MMGMSFAGLITTASPTAMTSPCEGFSLAVSK
jgi:hypothetical protein